MSRFLHADRAMALTGLTVLGMGLAILAWWPLAGAAAGLACGAGLALVYLAGGLPQGNRSKR